MTRFALPGLVSALALGGTAAVASGLDENVMDPGGPGVFAHQGPIVRIETYSTGRHGHSRMDVFRVADGRFIARRATDRLGKDSTVGWTTSEACPALNGVLADLEQVRAPLIELPGLKHATRATPLLDGISYHLWTRWGRYDGGTAWGAVEMAGNVDSPLAKWSDSADARLAPCWSGTRPPEPKS